MTELNAMRLFKSRAGLWFGVSVLLLGTGALGWAAQVKGRAFAPTASPGLAVGAAPTPEGCRGASGDRLACHPWPVTTGGNGGRGIPRPSPGHAPTVKAVPTGGVGRGALAKASPQGGVLT